MEKNSDFKTFATLGFIGYAVFLIIRYIEWIILSLLKIVGYSLHINTMLFDFLQLIPNLLVIIFWILLIIKVNKHFDGNINIKKVFTRKRLFYIGISIIGLAILYYGIQRIEVYFCAKYGADYIKNYNLLSASSFLKVILDFIELVVIALGLLKVSKNKVELSTQ